MPILLPFYSNLPVIMPGSADILMWLLKKGKTVAIFAFSTA